MVYHVTYDTWADPRLRGGDLASQFVIYRNLESIFGTGWVGVQVFFVISGFVIAYSANGKTPWSYAKSRFLRLIPGLWICATISIPFLLLGGMPLARGIIAYANTLIVNPIGPHTSSAFWTLPIEIAFYGLVFLMIAAGRFRHIEKFAVALGLYSSAFWMCHFIFDDKAKALLHIAFGMNPATQLLLMQHGCYFALGIMIWLAMHLGITKIRAAVVLWLLVVGVAAICGESLKAFAWTGNWHNPAAPALIWLAGVGILIGSIKYNGRVTRIVAARERWIKSLGMATYPLYLIHQPIAITLAFIALRNGWSPGSALIVSCVCATAVAIWIAAKPEPALRSAMSNLLSLLQNRLPSHSFLLAQRSPLGRS